MKLILKLQPSNRNGFRKCDIVTFDTEIFSEAYFLASKVTDQGDHTKKFPQVAHAAGRMNDSQTSALEPFDQPASPLAAMISKQVKTTAACLPPSHGITCDSSHISSTSFLVLLRFSTCQRKVQTENKPVNSWNSCGSNT